MFWQLVLALERSAAAILRWSSWRRWHQAWARYHHYRRREQDRRPETSPGTREAVARDALDADGGLELVEELWQRLQELLPTDKRRGRPCIYDRRSIVAAIVHQRQSGCAWNALPSDFPPYQTVHTQLRNWQKTGVWAKVWEGLEQPCPSG